MSDMLHSREELIDFLVSFGKQNKDLKKERDELKNENEILKRELSEYKKALESVDIRALIGSDLVNDTIQMYLNMTNDDDEVSE